MAFKKSLTQRLLSITKISSQTLANCRISSSSVQSRMTPSASKPDLEPDPGDNGIFRRFLHKRAVIHPAVSAPFSGSLVEKLRTMDIAKSRIQLDGLSPPVKSEVTVEDAKKLLKLAQLEMVKSRLREIRKSCIPHSEFIRICEESCSDRDQASSIAKMLDASGAVIILGNVVFLRPEQVAKAIQNLLVVPGAKEHDTARKELEEMEKQKGAIDTKADYLVRRELWAGLGFLVAQTALFMRLTFWELSWDVMEPICFYVTSMYFMAGYAFFLRTSKEPSFEGFYQSRFTTHQKRLMELYNFDLAKYNKLRETCSFYPSSPSESDSCIASPFDNTIHL